MNPTFAAIPPAKHKTRDQTADLILDAAIACITERGLGQISMIDIAQRAGVGRSTLYRHFPRMKDILIRALQRDMQALMQRLYVVVDSSHNAEDMMVEAFVFFLRELPRRLVLHMLITREAELLQRLSLESVGFNMLGAQFAKATYDRANAEGRIRDDVSLEDFIEWTTRVVVSLVVSPYHSQDDSVRIRQYLRKFLVPSVMRPGDNP
jgi:AcrR family transcriptional regulator